jgi:hypothetical protein
MELIVKLTNGQGSPLASGITLVMDAETLISRLRSHSYPWIIIIGNIIPP